jgi:hypothetical protein
MTPDGVSSDGSSPARVSERVDLEPRAYRTWSIDLPADPFQTVSGKVPIPHAGGEGFVAEVRGSALALDTDGDGAVDRVLEGVVDPTTKVQRARATLRGKRADGSSFEYPVRFEGQAGAWRWAAGGALETFVGNTELRLVDLDGNGRHGDVGRDAIVVGDGEVAQYLGELVHVDGKLFAISVDADGQSLAVAPYEGPAGVLDVRSALDAKGVLLAAVVKSEDGKQSFELSGAEEGLAVPPGRYRLVKASLGLGDGRVHVDARSMKAMDVESDGRTAFSWGGPVKATFVAQRQAGQLVFDPAHVRYVGAAGEQWIDWHPIGKSPTFRVKEKETGDVLVDVVFPGSC